MNAQESMTSELNWMFKAAKQTKEYDECIEKKFSGRLPYRMVMNAILKNQWTNKSEGGSGKDSFWSVSNTNSDRINYSIYYNCHTGVVDFTLYEAK